MALFVRYMCSVAVLGRGNFPTAILVHTILPTASTWIFQHQFHKTEPTSESMVVNPEVASPSSSSQPEVVLW